MTASEITRQQGYYSTRTFGLNNSQARKLESLGLKALQIGERYFYRYEEVRAFNALNPTPFKLTDPYNGKFPKNTPAVKAVDSPSVKKIVQTKLPKGYVWNVEWSRNMKVHRTFAGRNLHKVPHVYGTGPNGRKALAIDEQKACALLLEHQSNTTQQQTVLFVEQPKDTQRTSIDAVCTQTGIPISCLRGYCKKGHIDATPDPAKKRIWWINMSDEKTRIHLNGYQNRKAYMAEIALMRSSAGK